VTLTPSSLPYWVAIGLLANVSAALAEPWAANTWNPKPDDEDIVLPMPCEGSMAFRRVRYLWQGLWMICPSHLARMAVTGGH
jgi:hypothetical protein